MGIFVDDEILDKWAKELLNSRIKKKDDAISFLVLFLCDVGVLKPTDEVRKPCCED